MAMKHSNSKGKTTKTNEKQFAGMNDNEKRFKLTIKTKTSSTTPSSPFKRLFLYGCNHMWIMAMIIQAVCRPYNM